MPRKSIFIAAAIMAAVLTSPSQAQFAIALDATTGKLVTYGKSADGARNQREALSACGKKCQIIATGNKNCAAVAATFTTGGSIWAVAYGTTISDATQSAFLECRNKGGVNCKTAAAICD